VPPLSRDDGPAASRVLLVVAAGGMLGALARHAALVVAPQPDGSFAWTVLAINVSGCALLGVLTGWIAAGPVRHPLARPFLGVGVLGGFTTFSTFSLDLHQQLDSGTLAAAAAYGALSVGGCVLAALAGLLVGSRA